MSASPVAMPHSTVGVTEWPLRGWGSYGDGEAEKDHRPWPLGVLGQSSSPSAFLRQLQAWRPQSAHLGRKGGTRGLPAGLSQCQAGWGPGKGLPTSLSSEGIALPPNPPLPTTPPGSCLGLFPLRPMSSPCSPHPPACPDINECEEDGIECGPGQMCFNTRGSYQCVDTPCPATYRQGSSPG